MSSIKDIPLTLIVAATAAGRGIGKDGKLPWRLSSELQYFSRVTTRIVSSLPSSQPTSEISSVPARNAVIMGRKTWESIPPRHRPLKNRINVILSRSPTAVAGIDVAKTSADAATGFSTQINGDCVVVVKSMDEALHHLLQATVPSFQPDASRAFVIGGASIYEVALKMEQTKRVLLTAVFKDFECDTFFTADLDSPPWQRRSTDELARFTGEAFGQGQEKVREGDVEFEYQLYER